MASSAQKLDGEQNRAMVLPKGDGVEHQAEQRPGCQDTTGSGSSAASGKLQGQLEDNVQINSDQPSNAVQGQEDVKVPQKKRGRKRKQCMPAALDNSSLLSEAETHNPTTEGTPGGRPKRRAATVALQYLHDLSKEMTSLENVGKDDQDAQDACCPKDEKTQSRGRGKKRKIREDDSDALDDADFVPEQKEAEVESEEDDECVYSDEEEFNHSSQSVSRIRGSAINGLSNSVMSIIWSSATINKNFRNENLLSWAFPEWMPSAKDWHFLSASEAENYMPKETESPTFTNIREGCKEERPLHKLQRFESFPYHADRWDTTFFAGGPVWSMEWCPCPDGAPGSQYAALYCNRDMDGRHKTKELHTEPGLLQLWDLGVLSGTCRPSAMPCLAYAIAQDEGCIWSMKWCPSGAWEMPATKRKFPQMARLGLLAAAYSNGKILIYALPHPNSLLAHRKSQMKGEVGEGLPVCRVQPVLNLKLGCGHADHTGQSGQCFSFDWLPMKPHNLLAAGFYDGTVALWDLSTKSSLLRVRTANKICLYPYHCFLAHDDVIRTVNWCRASSDLIATAGDDRMIKMWDLRKTHDPVSTFRRYLTTEAAWPVRWSGILLAQECCYATQNGIHFIESGFVGYRPHFVAPRKSTIWSISFSDWLNTCVTGDNIGELIMCLLIDLSVNPNGIKRTADRRFPVYRAEMVCFNSVPMGNAAGPEPTHHRDVVKKYYLCFHDTDMRNFKSARDKPSFKHMRDTEIKGEVNFGQMPLNALYKVRLNPNLGASTWVLSAGQSGLVRAHCLRPLNSPVLNKVEQESAAQFAAMFQSQEGVTGDNSATSVQHSTTGTVKVF
ncbi:general transcription factor 3C polypeptide 2 isoform X2 [Denticeps clupeoides]|uniref:General transcription factor 3C polypeptide 2 n=1 Tax=Denticeps clupeoides TaxID=299321 RepID=A0AAY4CGG8_9TELE|nr:general transcription factor 3C polypeptide 2 isoform X2 [Denticeps clupeoides]